MKTLHGFCLSMLFAACTAAPAFAQSNVTVYGVADVYVQVGKGSTSTVTSLQSGGLVGSRLGFKGKEDLGGGLSALFQLETGMALDSGTVTQGGVFWGRQALVGLSSSAAGTVTVGRQYVPHFNAIDDADPFGTGAGSAASSGIVSLLAIRANNSLVYATPDLGPFSVTLLGSLGEGTTSKFYSGYGRYASKNLEVGLSVAHKNKFGNNQVAATLGVVTAGYDFGVLKVTGGFQRAKNPTQARSVKDDRDELFAGVLVPVGSATLTAGYGTGKTRDVSGTRASQWSLGGDYALSKRTKLYAIVTDIDNGRLTGFTTDTATGSGPTTVAGKDVRALQFGIRHRF